MCGRNYAELLEVDALSTFFSLSLFALSGVSTATLREAVNHSKPEPTNAWSVLMDT